VLALGIRRAERATTTSIIGEAPSIALSTDNRARARCSRSDPPREARNHHLDHRRGA
jgi:hypothetical protein